MGNSSTILLQKPETIYEFRKCDVADDECAIPEIRQKRIPTDIPFLILLSVFIAFLIPCLIYTLINSDINRFVHGYDSCGNVCGSNNPAVFGISCSGKDFTDEPFLRYTTSLTKDTCVTECNSGEQQSLYQCFPSNSGNRKDIQQFDDFMFQVAADIRKSLGYIFLLSLIGLCLSVGMLFLFGYCPGFIVWTILIGSCLVLILLTVVLWALALVPVAIFFTIISLIILVILLCMIKRIKLIIRLFQEAIKVVFGIPIILFEPILTIFAGVVLCSLVYYMLLTMLSAGYLQSDFGSSYKYIPNQLMSFTMIFLLIMFLWLTEFFKGCQQIAISGSIAAYYFARDKASLSRSHIYNSFYNLFWFHLGTVAFGSLLITLVTLVKIMIRLFVRNRLIRCMLNCCISRIENILKYLSKQAYILTAIHGQDFYKSGKRAVNLLSANAISAIAVNSVGDYVLFMAKILVVVFTVLIGLLMNTTEVQNFWAVILIAAILTAIIVHCFFVVYEIAIDTIFLCYCEDECMHEDINSTYYMPASFKQYIDEAKQK